jgi:hypothetical protein
MPTETIPRSLVERIPLWTVSSRWCLINSMWLRRMNSVGSTQLSSCAALDPGVTEVASPEAWTVSAQSITAKPAALMVPRTAALAIDISQLITHPAPS